VEQTPPRTRHPREGEGEALSFSALKQRQLLFLLTRQLAEAQFQQADQARANWLWQEAADLELDPDRIITLLYGVADHADLQEMEAVDRRYRQPLIPPRRPWWTPTLGRFTRSASGVWHRSAPPASSPARS